MSLVKVGNSFVKVGNSMAVFNGPAVLPDPPTENFLQLSNNAHQSATLYVTSGANGQLFVNDIYAGRFTQNTQKSFSIPSNATVKITGLRPRGNGWDYGTLTTDSSSNNFSIDRFDESSVNPAYMFCRFSGLKAITSWTGAQNYTILRDTFAMCSGLSSIPSSWSGLGSVEEMVGTFNGCSLAAIPGSWSTLSTIKVMGDVFNGSPFTTIPSTWDFPSTIRRLYGTFNGCRSITAIPNSWTGLENVYQMSNVFENCSSVVTGGSNNMESLSNITNFNACFKGCTSWTGNGKAIYDYLSTKPVTVTGYSKAFYDCVNCIGYSQIPSSWK